MHMYGGKRHNSYSNAHVDALTQSQYDWLYEYFVRFFSWRLNLDGVGWINKMLWELIEKWFSFSSV